jgi:hypothetical protein
MVAKLFRNEFYRRILIEAITENEVASKEMQGLIAYLFDLYSW